MEKTTGIIKNLKKGQFVLIDGEPCRVVSVNVSKAGKHGAAKARVEGMGLFDHRRHSIVKPADDTVEIPIVVKKNAQILALMGNKVQLMDLQDYSIFEVDIPEHLKGKLEPGKEINYFEVMGRKTLHELK